MVEENSGREEVSAMDGDVPFCTTEKSYSHNHNVPNSASIAICRSSDGKLQELFQRCIAGAKRQREREGALRSRTYL